VSTLGKSYSTDLQENFTTNVPVDMEELIIRLRIRIQEFFKGFFNIAI